MTKEHERVAPRKELPFALCTVYNMDTFRLSQRLSTFFHQPKSLERPEDDHLDEEESLLIHLCSSRTNVVAKFHQIFEKEDLPSHQRVPSFGTVGS